jgi:hypothetical protein
MASRVRNLVMRRHPCRRHQHQPQRWPLMRFPARRIRASPGELALTGGSGSADGLVSDEDSSPSSATALGRCASSARYDCKLGPASGLRLSLRSMPRRFTARSARLDNLTNASTSHASPRAAARRACSTATASSAACRALACEIGSDGLPMCCRKARYRSRTRRPQAVLPLARRSGLFVVRDRLVSGR